MKKGIFLIIALLNAGFINADGLVTLTNQSAAWVRLPSRNATTAIDAVYYNPAGLTKLKNGFHFSFSNQSIFQSKTIENSYSGEDGKYPLNSSIYKGSANEFFTPSLYAVYKKDRFAFSLGYNMIGGDGIFTYEKGLPSFELYQPDIIPFLPASIGATEYNSDIYFKSGFVVRGLQSGVSIKLNDLISLSAGIRLISAKRISRGHIKDIEVFINPGIWSRADLVMNYISALALNAYTGTAADRGTSALVTAGTGSLTLAQVEGIYISPARRAELEAALSAFGYPAGTIISSADSIFQGIEEKYTSAAPYYGDRFINTSYEGNGITPVFCLNISPSEKLNVSIRYEMLTKLELKNKSKTEVIRNDMPALLALGIVYNFSKNLSFSSGADYFFDKSADYGHKWDDDMNSATPTVALPNSEIIESNGMSLQAGLEYNISENLLVSGGYVWANKGVNAKYQSDLTYGLATQTFGLGGAYSVNEKIQINLGAGYTIYKDDTKVVDHIFSGNNTNIQANETYSKRTFVVGVGVDFRF